VSISRQGGRDLHEPGAKGIHELLASPETTLLDFKERLGESAFKTLSAFSNTDGGVVVIGVSDKKQIVGVECSNKFIGEVSNSMVHNLGVHPRIDCFEIEGKFILKIEVKKSTLPVSYRGRYYKRVGNTTREMQGDELRGFFIKGTNWDGLTGDFSMEEIDEQTVMKFVGMARRSGRLGAVEESEGVQTILEKLKLVVDGKPTNGAVMLFGKDPRKYFINAVVRVGRFKTPFTIIGDRVIEGNLFRQVTEAEEAIKNFIGVRYEITGESLARKNVWDYPLPAIREALLNAVIHRDYFRYNVQTQIKIFDDHIWFFNIGGLPDGITLEQLYETHPSVARNPLIVHVFYLSGMIEEYGSGINRMMGELDSAALPAPEFREEFGGFPLYFRKDPYTEEYLRELGLNERQIKAVMYVKGKGKITNMEYREMSHVSDRTALLDLKDLSEKGILARIGKTGRVTRYIMNVCKPETNPKNPKQTRNKPEMAAGREPGFSERQKNAAKEILEKGTGTSPGTPLKSPQDATGVGAESEKSREGTTQKTAHKTTQEILSAIRTNPAVTRSELASILNMTDDGAKYHLDKLRRQGVIKRVGPRKGGHWEVIENDE